MGAVADQTWTCDEDVNVEDVNVSRWMAFRQPASRPSKGWET
jgi:hypothetical protein